MTIFILIFLTFMFLLFLACMTEYKGEFIFWRRFLRLVFNHYFGDWRYL